MLYVNKSTNLKYKYFGNDVRNWNANSARRFAKSERSGAAKKHTAKQRAISYQKRSNFARRYQSTYIEDHYF